MNNSNIDFIPESPVPVPSNAVNVVANSNATKIIIALLITISLGLLVTVVILAMSLTNSGEKIETTPTPTVTTAPTSTFTPTITPTNSPTPTSTPTTKPTTMPTNKITVTSVTLPTPTEVFEGDAKPVIYLYPQKTQLINVKLNYLGNFTVTYPEYKGGWNVIAQPNGDLLNMADLREYSYLFWEGIDDNASYDLSTGFVVKGNEAAEFLQEKLSEFGLTPKEYNEFIVYWLPKMMNNKYTLVHFASKEEYSDRAQLVVSPKPDSVLRVFMVIKPIKENISITPQKIKSFERKGFSVVEWGGRELHN